MPPPQACLPAFAPDPRPVTKVPNAPVSSSLGLKKLGGGLTCVEDPTGSPPKVVTACEANIATAKAISLFIFVLEQYPLKGAKKSVGAVALKAKICVDSWAGRREFPCEIMGETKTKYVCRMSGDGVLPGKHVRLGDVVKLPKRAVRIETPDHERGISRQDKTQEESALPQGRGDSLVAQLDSAVNQAEQFRDQQTQQQYSDQLGVYVQEKAEQIDRLQSSLAAALTSEQAQLQAIQHRAPGWTVGKKAHAQWEQQVARRKTRIAQIALRLDRVGEIEEAAGVYAERKIEELAEHKLGSRNPSSRWSGIRFNTENGRPR